MLEQGSLAPDFTLPDQSGENHSLSDFRGQWIILYFYPKDLTPGCTTEACNFRDDFPEFQKLNTTILGVSKDSVKRHSTFAQKYKLPFLLLELFNMPEAVMLASSGTGAMEACITNLTQKKALTVNSGKFGERFGKICDSFGIEKIELQKMQKTN